MQEWRTTTTSPQTMLAQPPWRPSVGWRHTKQVWKSISGAQPKNVLNNAWVHKTCWQVAWGRAEAPAAVTLTRAVGHAACSLMICSWRVRRVVFGASAQTLVSQGWFLNRVHVFFCPPVSSLEVSCFESVSNKLNITVHYLYIHCLRLFRK